MARNDPLLDYLIDHLSPLGAAQGRPMFGGFGVYLDGSIIGLIAFDMFYLKVDEITRPDFEAAGAEPFRYGRSGKTATINAYWTCPPDVLEEPDLLRDWADKALAVSRRAGASKKKPKRKVIGREPTARKPPAKARSKRKR